MLSGATATTVMPAFEPDAGIGDCLWPISSQVERVSVTRRTPMSAVPLAVSPLAEIRHVVPLGKHESVGVASEASAAGSASDGDRGEGVVRHILPTAGSLGKRAVGFSLFVTSPEGPRGLATSGSEPS